MYLPPRTCLSSSCPLSRATYRVYRVLRTTQVALYQPPSTLFVSVYESGSRDASRRWLQVLRMLLLPLHVPFNITTAGGLRRAKGQGRIHFLAQVGRAGRSTGVTRLWDGRSGRNGGMPARHHGRPVSQDD